MLNFPTDVKKISARIRLLPWFRDNLTAWVYEYAKKHMSKHIRVYRSCQIDIGSEAFKRAFVTHRNAVTSAVKITLKTNDCDGSEREEMMKEDLEKI